MRHSHLERYIDIINLLARYGPQKQTQIMDHANVNSLVIEEDLRFLIKQALIEEQTTMTKRVVFRATQRGLKVIKYFQSLKQISPII